MSLLDKYSNTNDKPRTLTERILFRVMDDLNDRSGFDDWWGNIDEEIQNDILNDLHQTIESELKAEK